jgi:hypothetical protein
VYEELKNYFSNPKFLHVFFEWGMLWGLLFGFFGLLLAKFVFNDRKAQILAMLLVAASAGLMWPATHYRVKAGARTSESVQKLKDLNEDRRTSQWAYYIVAGFSLIALAAGGESAGKGAQLLYWGLALATLALALFTLWLQIRGTRLQTPDF